VIGGDIGMTSFWPCDSVVRSRRIKKMDLVVMSKGVKNYAPDGLGNLSVRSPAHAASPPCMNFAPVSRSGPNRHRSAWKSDSTNAFDPIAPPRVM
jgi:hypothetical protein